MKKIFFFSIGVIFIVSSCKKNASHANTTSTNNAISLSVNNVTEAFNTNAVATQLNASGTYSLTINGTGYQPQDTDQVTIIIKSNTPITKGTYSVASTPPQQASVIYTTNSNKREWSNDTANGSYQPQVTITSISNTNVQGTFGGNLILFKSFPAGIGNATTNISNGKFNVAIKQ